MALPGIFGMGIFGSFLVNQLRIFARDFWGFLPGIFVNQLGIFGGGFCLGVFGRWEFLDIPIH